MVKPHEIFYINGTDIKEFYFNFTNPNISLIVNDYTKQQYVSSIEPSTVDGGKVVLHGDFGEYHDNLTVSIGNLECDVISVNETVIECDIGPGEGVKDVVVFQNSFTWSGLQIYQYISNQISCPNNCTNSNQGACDLNIGICTCTNGFTGLDCSSKDHVESSLPESNTNVNVDDGTSSITNDDIKFETFIGKLIELDLSDNVIESFDLDNKWVLDKEKSNANTYTFLQYIAKVDCTITATFDTIDSDKQISFGGIDFTIEKSSIKISISIENYKYSSVLNRLQLQVTSTANQLSNKNNCNTNDTETNIDFDESQSSYVQLVTISKNGKSFYGRLINRVISDGRNTFISNSLISKNEDSITIGLNLPHCTQCLIDPDFSVLLKPDFKSSDSCKSKSKNKGYVIPVAVTIPVVAVAAISGLSIFLYKKKIQNKEMKQIKNRLEQLN
ncbi:hypothetical protein DICPUDRAFT_29272 [Dictyostelium purpureum]|uniref:EGF-like domain-containing protein n=1 Tax=Dictyostelium purpureum TaxID=5786 RepID=F0ZDB6_DICPU|nr:uncharacterized protein DICPUDRAFT_29272 [Dictyostelium purpureum]EGC38080.1 hypothetical protein DICPUDRAFT_29272 [Dictyostelium purpureum]|eukprot:XP_003285387.1 hypothetical protein DICPUDRAFT_29272 [Dictyostelium purpureum]